MRLHPELLVWVEIGKKVGYRGRARAQNQCFCCMHSPVGETSKNYKNTKNTSLAKHF